MVAEPQVAVVAEPRRAAVVAEPLVAEPRRVAVVAATHHRQRPRVANVPQDVAEGQPTRKVRRIMCWRRSRHSTRLPKLKRRVTTTTPLICTMTAPTTLRYEHVRLACVADTIRALTDDLPF